LRRGSYEVPHGVGKVGNEDPSFVEPISEWKDGLKAMMSRMAQKRQLGFSFIMRFLTLLEPS
jgi:hypothetical protein